MPVRALTVLTLAVLTAGNARGDAGSAPAGSYRFKADAWSLVPAGEGEKQCGASPPGAVKVRVTPDRGMIYPGQGDPLTVEDSATGISAVFDRRKMRGGTYRAYYVSVSAVGREALAWISIVRFDQKMRELCSDNWVAVGVHGS